MSSSWFRTSCHYEVLLAVAFLYMNNAEVRSQSQPANSGLSEHRTSYTLGLGRSAPVTCADNTAGLQQTGLILEAPEPKPGSASAPPATLQAPVDLEALKQMIREELKAEKEEGDQKKKAEEAHGAQSQWLEGGKDLKLEASVRNGFVAETADKAFRFHFGGRLDFDNAWFTQDKNLLIGSSPTTTLQDGADFRRARFRADGQVWEFIGFVAEVSFATIQDVSNVDNSTVPVGSVGLTNFYVTFRDLPVAGNLRVGHFTAPYGLERYTGSNAWYYMERSSVYDAFFNPNDYQNGVILFNSYLDDRVTAASSFTRVGKATVDSFGFGADNGLYATGIRLTGLPIYQDDGRVLLHLGVDYFHQALSGHTFAAANRMPLRQAAGRIRFQTCSLPATFSRPTVLTSWISSGPSCTAHSPCRPSMGWLGGQTSSRPTTASPFPGLGETSPIRRSMSRVATFSRPEIAAATTRKPRRGREPYRGRTRWLHGARTARGVAGTVRCNCWLATRTWTWQAVRPF
jgi:hypothetical protein